MITVTLKVEVIIESIGFHEEILMTQLIIVLLCNLFSQEKGTKHDISTCSISHNLHLQHKVQKCVQRLL